jgi:hypothetical protein
VSALANTTLLVLLVTMSGTVGVSGLILVMSIQKEDAGAAWAWAGVFVVTSILAAWIFWGLV